MPPSVGCQSSAERQEVLVVSVAWPDLVGLVASEVVLVVSVALVRGTFP